MKYRIMMLSVTMLASSTAAAGDPDSDEVARRGAELLQPFQQALQTALREGMKEGPANAVEVCRLEAPEIAARVAPEDVAMGRTSHRLRNPDNAPLDWQREMLEYYLDNPDDRQPRQTRLDETRVAHVQPIETQPMCLSCHGSDLDESVQARLDELYPEDRATGFAAGELRGIFWVTMPDE